MMKSFTIHEDLTLLAEAFQLHLIPSGSGYILSLPAKDAHSCTLTIGPDALDWYITIQCDDARVPPLTEWADYLGYDKTPQAELIAHKINDIRVFVEHWMHVEGVRHRHPSSFFNLKQNICYEWRKDGMWSKISIAPG